LDLGLLVEMQFPVGCPGEGLWVSEVADCLEFYVDKSDELPSVDCVAIVEHLGELGTAKGKSKEGRKGSRIGKEAARNMNESLKWRECE
jgi:hypothetical protein